MIQKKLRIMLLIIITVFIAGCAPNDSNSFEDMHQGMNHEMMMHSVNSEYEFLIEMIPHHQEAVDSSQIILDLGGDSRVKELATNIIAAQKIEINQMNSWLDEWYTNESRENNYVEMMPSVEGLSPIDADRAYLQGMIMHHMMAVVMAESVLGIEELHEETISLANAIIETQNQEIELMGEILSSLS